MTDIMDESHTTGEPPVQDLEVNEDRFSLEASAHDEEVATAPPSLESMTDHNDDGSEPKDEGQDDDDAAAEDAVSDDADPNSQDSGDADSDDTESDADWDIRYESPPLDLNYNALKHIATYYMPGSHGACTDISTLMRGSYHEIRVLHFVDGWSCIGRFTRVEESLAKTESELATMEYVRQHTTIPVPQIYLVNFNRNHVVGAAFVLMEKVEGTKAAATWYKMSHEHKLSVIEQLADVVGQLSDLKFDAIGSLKANGELGPLLNHSRTPSDDINNAPLTSTADYVDDYFKSRDDEENEELISVRHKVKSELHAFLKPKYQNRMLHAPYRLIHADLDTQNIMLRQDDKNLPPKISGIIDWDWSYVGLAYHLYDYSDVTIDYHLDEDNFAENKTLRKHFVRCLLRRHPKGSPERAAIQECFREKSYVLNHFKLISVRWEWSKPEQEINALNYYLGHLTGKDADGNDHDMRGDCAYGDLEEWHPDTDVESDGENADG